MEIINQINTLITTWKTQISICQNYIERGIDVEGWQRLKNECTEGYHRAHALLYKEMTTTDVPKVHEETENGFYQAEDDERRNCEAEEMELYNQENL